MQRTFPLTDFASVSSIIAQLRIFGGTTDTQLATIFRHLELWTLPPGDVVFRKGDEPMHIYVVKSGKIDLQLSESAVLIHKHELQIGECFGEADRKSTRLNSSHLPTSRMPSSA